MPQTVRSLGGGTIVVVGVVVVFIVFVGLSSSTVQPPPKQDAEWRTRLRAGTEKFKRLSRAWSEKPTPNKCFVDSDLPCQVLEGKGDWEGGCGPGFLVIGSPKSGTTGLYEYLTTHPQVSRALGGHFTKELRFFSEWYGSASQYINQFPPIKKDSVTVNGDVSRVRVMSGEASPTYLFDFQVPRRVKEMLPNVKLIALLRDPVERIYSYWKMVMDGKVHGRQPFEATVELQINNFQRCFKVDRKKTKDEMMQSFLSCFGSPATRGEPQMYVLASIYYFQFQNWLKYFPRDQLLVISSERFLSNTNEVMDEITEFLGLCPIDWKPITARIYNKRKFLAGIPMSESIKEKLRDFYAPFNLLLESELGMTFPEWGKNQRTNDDDPFYHF